MKSFKLFLSEAKKPAVGIQHLEHPSQLTFDSADHAKHAIKTLKGVVAGKEPITRKIDDKMSYQAVRTPEGKVGVKYKGPGAAYNFSHQDIDTQHGHKPYLAHPLKALVSHLDKVLPKREGEYQGGFMSTPEMRAHHAETGHVSHQPNTIEYRSHIGSDEGKKLHGSKVSTVIHTELKGPDKQVTPITSTHEFGSHKDVHLVPHVVAPEERKLPAEDKKVISHHLDKAEDLMKGHTWHHMAGHEVPLRTYVNSTITSGNIPSTEGYKQHLAAAHDKKIDAVKMAATKQAKAAEKHAAITHVDKHKSAFDNSLAIHHHVQQATNHLATSLDKASSGGFETRINGEKAGGEGYVAGGSRPVKIVNINDFTKANRARSEAFKKKAEDS